MMKDANTSLHCPCPYYPRLTKLWRLLSTGQCFLCVLAFLTLTQFPFSTLKAQYVALLSATIDSFQSEQAWATGISTYDINHDGWDDITAATSQHGVAIFLNINGDFQYINVLETIEGNLNSVYWADFDNDSDADLLVIRYGTNPILLRNEGNWSFTDVSAALPIPVFSPHIRSASWADYDNDGFLDLYVNNYYSHEGITNWLFRNNGDGTFTELAAILGVDDGNKPTYQSSWIDVDRDGDQDLYVANDRGEGNKLYHNTGQGNFIADSSLAINPFMHAMGIHWHDHDADGDFDVYVTNDIEPSVLIENRQGTFVDVTDSLQVGCPNHTSWGVQWTDNDNDGLSDLIVIHNDHNDITCHFQRNDDFSYVINPSSVLSQQPYSSFCLVTGDFNRDGREDLVQGTVVPNRLLIWLADSTSNNSATIQLQGVTTNYDGIGAIIELHAGNRQLIKQVTCGESYYGQCSQYEIFGIGSASTIDSILVHWPSGWTDVLYNANANQTIQIIEGTTYVDFPDTLLMHRCFNESVILETGASHSIVWENGDTLTTRVIEEEGTYSCTIHGLFNQPHHIVFQVVDFAPSIEYSITPIQCTNSFTGAIDVQPILGMESIQWDSGSNSLTLLNVSAGTTTAEIGFNNGCFTTLEITLENPEAIQPWIWSDTICANTSASINFTSFGGTGVHTWNWFSEDPNALSAGVHVYTITDEIGCVYQGQLTIHQREKPIVSWTPPVVCANEYANITINSEATLLFEWGGIQSTDSLSAGNHNFSYSSGDGCWYDTTYVISEYPEITLSIMASDSTMANGESLFYVNIFGGISPFTILWNTGDTSVHTQKYDELYLSCTVIDSTGCSAQEEIWLSNIYDPDLSCTRVYPNPAKDLIQLSGNIHQKWQLFDYLGRCVDAGIMRSNPEKIDVSSIEDGVYFLKIEKDCFTFIKY
jgi:hypothetical protein